MDDLLPEFLAETNEALAELDLALVRLERAPQDQPTLGLIFRLVHTIKGTCGFLGLPRLERVAHAAENVLGRMRDGALAPSQDVISLILAALDSIKAIVAGLSATGAEPDGDDAALIARLDDVAAARPPAAAPAAAAPAGSSKPRRPKARPAARPQAQATAGPAAAALTVAAAAPEPAAQTIRVAVDVLEELMTLVGELVLTRNQLLQLARAQTAATAFTAPLQRLSQITSDLQDGVMKTRMQPIGAAWNKLPRLVRDLAQETGKSINLEMQGQDTELDRQILELMRDPLTHMVRNSADHGLETTEQRAAAGKPETGRILLRAWHEGGHIIIEVSDDGRGIDVGRVRAKALSQNLATEAELSAMTDTQIRAFIFQAGFSTAAAVTAISGRGVGMDVVRANIARIGGTIELASTLGAGACFTIKIPLTLAIVSAVIVAAGGERFAIPQTAVRELVRVGRITQGGPNGMVIEQVGGACVLRLRDELLPLIHLSGLLRLAGTDTAASGSTVVVAAIGSIKLGIVVDEVFDTEEIVVKPVAPILRHVTMFSGNTILGDGSVIMILDPNGVARAAGIAARPASGSDQAAPPAPASSSAPVSLLLFRAGAGAGLHAVPLNLVARLEMVASDRIEHVGGGLVTQYRGQLMKLIAMDEQMSLQQAQPVLVFADGARRMGLLVTSIIDVVHGRLQIELGAARPGLLGTAIIGGQAADVLDTGHWLTLAWRDWFAAPPRGDARRRVLVVEDSDFFRQLIVPTLAAAGYHVTAAASAAAALALRDGGLPVDAIVSDIDMPEMDGLAFARVVRQGGAWAHVPMIALSAHDGPDDGARAKAAGFSAHVPKSRRPVLLDTLCGYLAPADSSLQCT